MRRNTALVRGAAVVVTTLGVTLSALAVPAAALGARVELGRSAFLPAATAAPPAPTGVTATASALGVAVAWDAVGESAATVSRSTDGGTSWQDVTTLTTDPASTARRHDGDLFALTPGAAALYRVTALSGGSPAVAGPPSTPATATSPRESIIATDPDQALVSLPVGGGDPVGLAADPGHQNVAVSPDGRQVVTAWQSPGAAQVVLYNLAGGSGRDLDILYANDQPISGLTWSPDGSTLAWTEAVAGAKRGTTQLVLGSPTGAAVRTVGAAAGLSPMGWLPDSQTLLTVSHDNEVFLVDVLSDTATDLGLRGTPRLTSDGHLLVLYGADEVYAAYAFDPGSRVVGPLLGRSVAQSLHPTKAFDLSSDGTRVLTATAAGSPGLLQASVDGSGGIGPLAPVPSTGGDGTGVWQAYRPVLTTLTSSAQITGFAIAPGGMDPATSFGCALDGSAATPCSSWTAPVLATGRHTLVVTGTEPGTLRRAVSARTWSVGIGTYTPLSARRVLDTRSGLGATRSPLGPAGTIVLTVPGLPANTTAVTLNLTAVGATTGTYLSAYPPGAARPATSSLNVPTAGAIANLVTVAVGPGGKVDITNSAGTVDVIADLEGYVAPGTGYRYASVSPTRIIDTRTGRGGVTGPVARIGVTLPVGELVPATVDLTGARALSLNVTAVAPTRAGWLTAYDYLAGAPATSNLDFAAGQDVANLVTLAADSSSSLAFQNGGSGTVQVVADLAGSYGSRGAAFTAVPPARIVDTRNGTGAPRVRVGAGQSITVTVPGLPRGTSAVAVNLTAVSPTASGYLVAYPAGTPLPGSSSVNFPAGRTVANAAVVAVDARGAMVITNAAGSTDVLVDLAGYYAF
ncbi:WD40 repeat domain-containing protein [Lapillicoccus sp.]|uniref:WD40 repeat domain-containing protein n=1 Tax=Lapillicoccus sp. TaxID=1909287 RepID=UPI0025ECD7A8|nr:WD40 repeat domain-containing protein [Lapillicoccus sp.]